MCNTNSECISTVGEERGEEDAAGRQQCAAHPVGGQEKDKWLPRTEDLLKEFPYNLLQRQGWGKKAMTRKEIYLVYNILATVVHAHKPSLKRLTKENNS